MTQLKIDCLRVIDIIFFELHAEGPPFVTFLHDFLGELLEGGLWNS
jgi:hypothetical protein